MTKEVQKRLGVISEVSRFIMRFADYSTLDVFHIPLETMRALMDGVIPYDDKEIREGIK